MKEVYHTLSYMENWFRSKFEWLIKTSQSLFDWVGGHPGTMALCALGFLVFIVSIAVWKVKLPEHRK